MAGWLDVPGPRPPRAEMHHSIWSDAETRDKGGGLCTAVAPELLLLSSSCAGFFQLRRSSPCVEQEDWDETANMALA